MSDRDEWTAEEAEEGVWYLIEPRSVRNTEQMFYDCIEHLNSGEYQLGKACLERLLDLSPSSIEAMNYLAALYEEKGERKKAVELWKKAVKIGRKALPEDPVDCELPWGIIDNRPFLRSLQALGLAHMEEGDMDKALSIFEENLSYNLNDNQGIRDLLTQVYFDKDLFDKVIELREMFPDDTMPSICYGTALAFFKKGKKEKATEELKDAVEYLPKVAKELLKSSHEEPERIMPGMITSGGWDQAYEYWRMFGGYWGKDELRWLKGVLEDVEMAEEK